MVENIEKRLASLHELNVATGEKAVQCNTETPSLMTCLRLVTKFSILLPVRGNHIFIPIGLPE